MSQRLLSSDGQHAEVGLNSWVFGGHGGWVKGEKIRVKEIL